MDWRPAERIDWNSKEQIIDLSHKLRAYMLRVHLTISARQKLWGDDPGVQGPMWVSRTTIPPSPELDASSLLFRGIEELNNGNGPYRRPSPVAINVQWTGHRADADEASVEPTISESEKYTALMKEVKSPVTILYVFGGAFCLGGPARCRKYAASLAEGTQGRCYTVCYRLAPQNPFPAGLLDILHAYLSLLAPPPGSFHDPVSAANIVLTGDSSGASMCLSLIQLLLTARRQKWPSAIRYHGQVVSLDLPGGFAGVSAALDHTLAMPSETLNEDFDVFEDGTKFTKPHFPLCDLWPTNPPRGHVYCESRMLYHPLVSPAASRDWTGAPPMWFLTGQDRSTDSAKVVAQLAARQGVVVLFEEWEAMPHSWPMLYTKSPQSKMFFREWPRICRYFAGPERVNLASKATFVKVENMRPVVVDGKHLLSLEIDDVIQLMREKARSLSVFTGKEPLRALL